MRHPTDNLGTERKMILLGAVVAEHVNTTLHDRDPLTG